MAVLIEGIAVVIRGQAIDDRYAGGWKAFVADVPNKTLCADRELACVGFMAPPDVEAYVESLKLRGLRFAPNGVAADIAVVDQMRGPIQERSWLQFGHVIFDGNKVAACRHAGCRETKLIVPKGWRYGDSLSQSFGFAPTATAPRSMTFLRNDKGVDVYLNQLTGNEVFVGRTTSAPILPKKRN